MQNLPSNNPYQINGITEKKTFNTINKLTLIIRSGSQSQSGGSRFTRATEPLTTTAKATLTTSHNLRMFYLELPC